MLDTKTAATALILALALGTAVTAVAQDAVQPETQAAPRRVNLAQNQGCGVDMLSPCEGRDAKQRKARAQAETSGRVSRFARLAGMFMGRVDVVDAGNFRFRFNLELR